MAFCSNSMTRSRASCALRPVAMMHLYSMYQNDQICFLYISWVLVGLGVGNPP